MEGYKEEYSKVATEELIKKVDDNIIQLNNDIRDAEKNYTKRCLLNNKILNPKYEKLKPYIFEVFGINDDDDYIKKYANNIDELKAKVNLLIELKNDFEYYLKVYDNDKLNNFNYILDREVKA